MAKTSKWQQKIDNCFDNFKKGRENLGKRFDKFLTVAMFASIIILIITVVAVISGMSDGRTQCLLWLKNVDAQKIIDSDYKIVITGKDQLSKVDIARIKAEEKTIFAYFPVTDDNNHEYWDENWQAQLFSSSESSLSETLNMGFDGIYLADVDSYEDHIQIIEGSDPPQLTEQSKERKQQMADLIKAVSEKASNYNENTKIYMENGLELLEYEELWDAIDGVGKENLLFQNGEKRSEAEIKWDEEILKQVVQAQKAVILVEYIEDSDKLKEFCKYSSEHLLIPSVTSTNADYFAEPPCK